MTTRKTFFKVTFVCFFSTHHSDFIRSWARSVMSLRRSPRDKRTNTEKILSMLFKKTVPRNKWLCVNDFKLGPHSLSHYFNRMLPEALLAHFRSLGKGMVKHNEEFIFRADRSQTYGKQKTWIAFGKQPPVKNVASQTNFLRVKKPGAPGTAAQEQDLCRNQSSQEVDGVQRNNDSDNIAVQSDSSGRKKKRTSVLDIDDPELMARISSEPRAEQTACCMWSWGQLHALLMLMDKLPRGSISKISQKAVGLCQTIVLDLKCNQTVEVASAEYAGRQAHPNLRYAIATVTAPGFSPTSAERTMMALGFSKAPNIRNIKRLRLDKVMPAIEKIAQDIVGSARAEIFNSAKEAGTLREINGVLAACCTYNSDGNGSKRSYNNFSTGEGASTVVMIGEKVVDFEYKQNNDRGNGFRNYVGSVATAESAAARAMGGRQLHHFSNVPLHMEYIAADGDAGVVSAMIDGQKQAGISERNLAKPLAVICHEIKNVNKKLMDFRNTRLTAKCNLTNGRIKAIGCDIRRVLENCSTELNNCSTAMEEEKVLRKYRDHHIPQIIPHHCGDCLNCDEKWCRHKKIQNDFPDLDKAAQEARYFGTVDDCNEGSRFTCFVDMSEETRNDIIGLLKRRYSTTSLRALTTKIVDNNNVERVWTRLVKFNQGKRLNTTQAGAGKCHLHMAVCEVNSGVVWLNTLDEVFGLQCLAQDWRAKQDAARDAHRKRKNTQPYRDVRKTLKKRRDANCGRHSGGWKEGRFAYKRDGYPAGQVRKRKPHTKSSICKHCKQGGHTALQCSFVKVGAPKKKTKSIVEDCAKIRQIAKRLRKSLV